jgi:hypothetical protein
MTSPRRYLTKSLFKKACECPRKLAYALSPKFLSKTGGQFLQSLAAEGQKVGSYSQLALFPQGIHVGGNSSTLDKLVEETRSLLIHSKPGTAIFEGAICSGPFLIRADILHKVADIELHLLEIKAKSWDSNKDRKDLLFGKRGGIKAAYLPYIRDVAFQKMIVSQAFPDYNVTAYLVLPDKNKINSQVPNLNGRFQLVEPLTTRIIGNHHDSVVTTPHIALDEESKELILQSGECLVTRVNVDDAVNMVLESELVFPGSKGETFPKVAADWASAVTSNNVLDSMASPPPIGNQCAKCEYRTRMDNHSEQSGFETCWVEASGLTAEELAQGTPIVDMWHGGSLVNKLISEQKYVMTDVVPEDLDLIPDGKEMKPKKKVDKNARGMSRAVKQWYQVNGVPSWRKNPAVVLDETFLNDEMDSWRFPLHFIDFETTMPALPFSVGSSPFDNVAFQFSHHVMHRDGSVEHASEFLSAFPGQCPNGAFLNALAACMDACDGTVFRWGAHENTILSALLQQEHCVKKTAVLESLLSGGSRAMVDLLQVVTTGYYVAGSDASSSIKKLLLPTMRASERLEDIYGQPTYSSSNFTEMQWWQKGGDRGQLRDPYSLLGALGDEEPAAASAVAQGGDAIIAYSALQQCNLDPTVRANIESSLLRYCELDTLAMVMTVQALQGFLQDAS